MVGISGSGKTTIASALTEELEKATDREIEFIDGDVIRDEFGGVFAYTYEERIKCNQAVMVVAKYLLKHNISVILAQIGAYEEMRKKVRDDLGKNIKYIEIYVKCLMEECVQRDVKGYYKKQKVGLLGNFNGTNGALSKC